MLDGGAGNGSRNLSQGLLFSRRDLSSGPHRLDITAHPDPQHGELFTFNHVTFTSLIEAP